MVAHRRTELASYHVVGGGAPNNGTCVDAHDTTTELTPLVLLVDDQDETAQSTKSILTPRGHVVLHAATGQQALDLTGKVSPDAVLVSFDLPDVDGIDLIRQLRSAPTVHSSTPVLIFSRTDLGRAERLEAMSAGAWDVLTHPLDANEIILRLDTFIRAKQEADRVRDQGLTDPNTGFYNVRGILRRTKEISADAHRHQRPLTCIAFGPTPIDTPQLEAEDSDSVAEAMSKPVATALRDVTRISDTLGRLGPGEFVVVAPGTDQDGAVRLADRVLEALRADSSRHGFGITAEALGQLRAGFYSIDAEDETSAEDILLRATMALRRAQAEDGSFRVRSYEA